MGEYDPKRRIFEIIEASQGKDIASKAYDFLMLVSVIVGLIPLTLKVDSNYTIAIDIICTGIFLFDYLIRLYTADYKMGVKSYMAYVAYVLSPMAIIDLLSIVPILYVLFPHVTSLGLLRIIRVLRLLKLTRYSKTFVAIKNVLRRVKTQLFAVLMLVLAYIIACAMIIFTVEPNLFENFFDALYWATVSITTIGYGDITPQSMVGKLITMVSSLIGMAVIALPTGIITAAYTDELKKKKGKHEL